ncbi:MAG: hypothetical protein GY797_04210 [Deltaproteobacteria bacterium]|nr:hypothetical protein [Deltaproteobacteria bacterium]
MPIKTFSQAKIEQRIKERAFSEPEKPSVLIEEGTSEREKPKEWYEIWTVNRLKRCKYCNVQPVIKEGGEWSFAGCVNPECNKNPCCYYQEGEEEEVFTNWNFLVGDVPIDQAGGKKVL